MKWKEPHIHIITCTHYVYICTSTHMCVCTRSFQMGMGMISELPQAKRCNIIFSILPGTASSHCIQQSVRNCPRHNWCNSMLAEMLHISLSLYYARAFNKKTTIFVLPLPLSEISMFRSYSEKFQITNFPTAHSSTEWHLEQHLCLGH